MVNPSYTPLFFSTALSHMALALAAGFIRSEQCPDAQHLSLTLGDSSSTPREPPCQCWVNTSQVPSVCSHKCNPLFSFDQYRQKLEMIGLSFLCFWTRKLTTVLAGSNCQHLTLALLPDCLTCCQSPLEHLGIALGLAAWEPWARITDNDYGT